MKRPPPLWSRSIILAAALAGALAYCIVAIASDTSPFMGLEIPAPGDPGPTYATNIQEALELIDAHDHSTGKGTKVTTAGYNETADHEMNVTDLTEVRTVRFDTGVVAIVAGDRRAVYQIGGELAYIDESGNITTITNNGAVNATPGSISGMTGSATVVYSPATNTYVFTDDSGAPGGLDAGCVRIAEEVSGGKGPVVCSNAATAADYAFTFMASLPGANRLLCLDAAGDLTTCTASAAAQALVVATSTSSATMSTTGDGAIGDDLIVYDDLTVLGQADVTGPVVAGGSVTGVGGIGTATATGGTTRAATNTSTTSTSPVDVTGLSFTGLTGGTTYTIWCDLGASSGATTTGIRVGLDFDAGGPSNVECLSFGSGGTYDRETFNTDDGNCAFANSISTGGAPTLYSLMGEFTGATSVTVRLRSESAGVAVRVTSGSTCTVAGP